MGGASEGAYRAAGASDFVVLFLSVIRILPFIWSSPSNSENRAKATKKIVQSSYTCIGFCLYVEFLAVNVFGSSWLVDLNTIN